MSSEIVAEIDSEPSSPHGSVASTYPYVFRRVYLCGHPDELIAVSQLNSPKRITYAPISLDIDCPSVGSRQSYSLERCRSCAERYFGEDNRISEYDEMRNRPRSMAAYQGAAIRRSDSVSSVNDGFGRVLKRLHEAKGARHNPASCEGDVGHAAHAGAPEGNMDVKALGVVSDLAGLFGDGRQPRQSCAEMDPATTQDHDVNVACKVQQTEVAQVSGGCGDASDPRTCETNIALRHCAASVGSTASPDDQKNKPRRIYALANVQLCQNDDIQQHSSRRIAYDQKTMKPAASAATFRPRLQEHDNSTDLSTCGMLDATHFLMDGHKRCVLHVSDADESGVVMHSKDTAMGSTGAATRWYESTPELDSDSESDHSLGEELQAPYLSPGTLRMLSMEVNNRLGSLYGAVNEPGISDFEDVPSKDAAALGDGTHRSRFSWGSSVYSDVGLEASGEGVAWWKPRPLVVKKDVPPPPPIPERNPLRLLRRTGQTVPNSSAGRARASRNILNLRLDLSKSAAGDLRMSVKSPKTERKRSYAASRRKSSRSKRETVSDSAMPNHILEAMRTSSTGSATRRQAEDTRDNRRSTRSVESKVPSRDRSHRDLGRTSGYAEKVKSARGHTRGASEPFRIGSVRSSTSSRWDAAMPSQGTVRRSCIPSLVNEHTVRMPAPKLAINKELPPLPVAPQSP